VLKQKDSDIQSTSKSKKEEATKTAQEAYDAIAVLCSANGERFQLLLNYLSNSYLSSRDKYPKTVVEAYNLLTNWRGSNGIKAPLSDGVSFTTDGDEEEHLHTTKGGILRKRNGDPVECYECSRDHYANKCPKGVKWKKQQKEKKDKTPKIHQPAQLTRNKVRRKDMHV